MRVTTRERGTIPSCRPAQPDDHMVHVPIGDIDVWLAELRAAIVASRLMRGACPQCGEMPAPAETSPSGRKLYCRCNQTTVEAAATRTLAHEGRKPTHMPPCTYTIED